MRACDGCPFASQECEFLKIPPDGTNLPDQHGRVFFLYRHGNTWLETQLFAGHQHANTLYDWTNLLSIVFVLENECDGDVNDI